MDEIFFFFTNWGQPTALDFGDNSNLKALDFGDEEAIEPSEPVLNSALEDSRKAATDPASSGTQQRVTFKCKDSNQDSVFALVFSAFQVVADCWLTPQKVNGFSYHAHERCQFDAFVKSENKEWVLELQRLSGSAIAFKELITELVHALDTKCASSDVMILPTHDVTTFSGGPSATEVESVLSNEGNALGHMIALAKVDDLRTQQESLATLATVISSVDNEHYQPLAELLVTKLQSVDDEVVWLSSHILEILSERPAFCAGFALHTDLVDIFMKLSIAAEGVEANSRRARANLLTAAQRLCAIY